MSATWGESEVWELPTPRAQDEINPHMTETVNDGYGYIMPLLLFRKRCLTCLLYVTPDANAVVLHVTAITPLYALQCRHAI